MNQPPFEQLSDWLAWQETLHPREIELGLDRIRQVANRLAVLKPAAHVITVGGTNGKGSSVAMLSAAYRYAGYKVGQYTSPHLIRYNERIVFNDRCIDDQSLCDAFSAVEASRQGVPLTYFEYGTLAALWWLLAQQPDVLLLEVGLGGRLDAVNIIDADIALITNVGMDHKDWLGDSREKIAMEKAGIARESRTVIYNDSKPVPDLLAQLSRLKCDVYTLGEGYEIRQDGAGSTWRMPGEEVQLPDSLSPVQVHNAAGVLACLSAGRETHPVDLQSSAAHLLDTLPDGRQQWRTLAVENGDIDVIYDVAHNEEAVELLAAMLGLKPCKGKSIAVFAALVDKPVEAMATCMSAVVDEWHLAGLDTGRGLSAGQLEQRMPTEECLFLHASPSDAWQAALSRARPGDRVVVFGSFYTVEAVMKVQKSDRSAQDV